MFEFQDVCLLLYNKPLVGMFGQNIGQRPSQFHIRTDSVSEMSRELSVVMSVRCQRVSVL